MEDYKFKEFCEARLKKNKSDLDATMLFDLSPLRLSCE